MKLKYEITTLEIDDKLMAVPLSDDDSFRGVLHMNDTTSSILNVLKEDVTEEEIVECLKKEYNASEERIRENVKKVLNILRENNLLVE